MTITDVSKTLADLTCRWHHVGVTSHTREECTERYTTWYLFNSRSTPWIFSLHDRPSYGNIPSEGKTSELESEAKFPTGNISIPAKAPQIGFLWEGCC